MIHDPSLHHMQPNYLKSHISLLFSFYKSKILVPDPVKCLTKSSHQSCSLQEILQEVGESANETLSAIIHLDFTQYNYYFHRIN